MSQSNKLFGALLLAFIIFITVRGELPIYLTILRGGGESASKPAGGSSGGGDIFSDILGGVTGGLGFDSTSDIGGSFASGFSSGFNNYIPFGG